MKILLLKFPDKQKQFIKEILCKTAFKKATIIESHTIEEASKSNIFEDLEIILFFGNPQDYHKNPTLKNVSEGIPLIYIVGEEFKIDVYPSILSDSPNYLPIKEVTCFVLEKCIFTTFEKIEIKNKLHTFELLQKEMIQKEQKYEDLFNNSSVGMYEIDSDGKFVMANDVFMKMLGLNDFNELNNFNAFKGGFSINGSRANLKNLLNQYGEVKDFEDIWINSDKSNIVVNEHIKVKKNKNGEIVYYQGFVENITQRKGVEEQLKTSEKVFENSIDMLCIAGYDGYFKTLNPAWTRTLGWSKEELFSKPWIEFVYPEDVEATENIKSVIVGGREIYQFENRYLCKDGTLKWLSWNTFPYPKEKIMYGVARDITEKKERESKLKILNQAIEQSPVSIVVTNLNGNIEYVNPKFSEATGYDRDDVLGANPRVLKTGSKSAEEYKLLWDTILSGKEWHGEFHNKKKDGTTFWEDAKISPIFNNEKLTHFVAVKEDITKRKEFEAELIKSKKEAEKSDKLKSEFLTQISHEIRTPVNTLLSFASLIKNDLNGQISEDLVSSFQFMDKAGKRLTRTIDLLVKISELHTDNYEPEFLENDLIEILEEILPDHKAMLQKK